MNQTASPWRGRFGSDEEGILFPGNRSWLGEGPIAVFPPLPGPTWARMDSNSDGFLEDLDGDGNVRFSDLVLLFKNMERIAEREPVGRFGLNGNGRVDFNDVAKLFQEW